MKSTQGGLLVRYSITCVFSKPVESTNSNAVLFQKRTKNVSLVGQLYCRMAFLPDSTNHLRASIVQKTCLSLYYVRLYLIQPRRTDSESRNELQEPGPQNTPNSYTCEMKRDCSVDVLVNCFQAIVQLDPKSAVLTRISGSWGNPALPLKTTVQFYQEKWGHIFVYYMKFVYGLGLVAYIIKGMASATGKAGRSGQSA